jgi:hypothetical protein
MYLSVMHFKWTLLVYGHVNFLNDECCHYFSLISVSSLFCLQINYLFGAYMRYGGVIITFQHQWLIHLAFNRGTWSYVLSFV